MSPSPISHTPTPRSPAPDTDLAQAFKEIAMGEQTAQALESNLTNLEQKIDALLASFEESERRRVAEQGKQVNGDGKKEEEAGDATK